MLVYRLTTEAYSKTIDGEGAKKYGGRWNPEDYAMLYASSHISLAALEILVHNESRKFLPNFILLDIELPKQETIKKIDIKNLKPDWFYDMSYTQSIGKDFLRSNLLIMQVPSIVINQEFNFLINPYHPNFKHVKVAARSNFSWDKRLLK